MNELLPCAHCGGEAVIQRSSPEVRWNSAFIVCEGCGIQTGFCETTTGNAADIAIAIWNRRVEPDDSGWDKVTDIVDPVHVVADIDDCPTQGQCPSCHKADGICAVDFRGEYLVYCPKCNLRTISCSSLADAIAVWDKVNKNES